MALVFDLKVGNYIEKIFYELETDKAVMFGRNIDDKVLFIPIHLSFSDNYVDLLVATIPIIAPAIK